METFEAQPLTGDRAGLRLTGELDLATAPILIEALRSIVQVNGSTTLDLSGLTFMDSSGIHAIVEYVRSEDCPGRVVLHGPTPIVARALEMVGIDRIPGVEVHAPESDG
jgi:anti-anti-sigma factor